jgi:hypothetical protein
MWKVALVCSMRQALAPIQIPTAADDGLPVLRFSNRDATANFDGDLDAIALALGSRLEPCAGPTLTFRLLFPIWGLVNDGRQYGQTVGA